VVTRAGDALGGWLHAAAGLGTSGVALAAIPGALALAWLGIKLGRRYQQKVAETSSESESGHTLRAHRE
jgi:outer membrane lipoprotein SlyB